MQRGECFTLFVVEIHRLTNDHPFVLQYSESKSFCEDLTEGKFSFPIIHAVNNQTNDRQVLREY